MKTLSIAVAAIVAVTAAVVVLTLPTRTLVLAPGVDGTVPGILHVHTNRSDGLSSPAEVAAKAAAAGLRFLVFTDHGDGTRAPDPPTYRSGVLCLDGVEISTTGGHYVALDMPQSPYPLAGEPRDVVEDVRRLGGFGIAAHPDSPKPQLQWRDWRPPVDAVELLNPDTSWRVIASEPGWRPKARLIAALFDYPFRAPEVIGSLIQPTGALESWVRLARERRVVAIAGADAHARLALKSADPLDSRLALPFPGYETSFRTMSVRVRPDRPMTGNAASDAAVLIRAVRNGHLYTAIEALAGPPSFDLTATNALGTVHEGDVLTDAGPVLIRVQSNSPPEFTTIVHDGLKVIASARDARDLVVHGGAGPALFWAEIRAPAMNVPWIRSNPVYVRSVPEKLVKPVGPVAPVDVPMSPTPRTTRPLIAASPSGPSCWRPEHDPSSSAAIDLAPDSGGALRFRFELGGGKPSHQYAAALCQIPGGIRAGESLVFRARAERPMRMSVQLRDVEANRWQRSVYADTVSRARTLSFDDFSPVGVTPTSQPPLDRVRAILFVVELTNTQPGTSGRLTIQDPALATSSP